MVSEHRGEGSIVVPQVRRSASPPRGEPLHVWHYTSTLDVRAIVRDCVMYPGTWGTDGPGVYLTDVPPAPDRLRIAVALWERWIAQKMEAYMRVPFIAGEMEPSARYPRIYVVKRSELRLTGFEDLEAGFWEGTDPSDPKDVGRWRPEAVTRCR